MNTTRLRNFFLATVTLAAMAGFQVSASAAFIEGGIGFGGLFTPTGGSGDLSDATGISIGFSTVTTASGDFAPALGANAVFNALNFSPANTPVTPLWSVSAGGIDYAFDLLNITVDFQSADEINLSGTGTVNATGFDATPGEWTFSGQQGNIFFTFSSITIAQGVAEPSVLLLMGIGMLGLVVARRRTN